MFINLLQKLHDRYTDQFIDGSLPFSVWQILEERFIRDSELFTVNLN